MFSMKEKATTMIYTTNLLVAVYGRVAPVMTVN